MTAGVGVLVARPLDRSERELYAAARLHAVHVLMPYLATAVFRLRPWAVEGLGTFAVDARWRVLLDPDVMRRWSVPEVAGVLLHEVGHALRDHVTAAAAVGGDLDRYAWNLCGDAAINDDLVRSGVRLPGAPVLPANLRDPDGTPLPDGLTASQYYERLPRHGDLRQPSEGADGPDGDAGAPATDRSGPGTMPAAGPVVRVSGRSAGAGSCGSVAGGDDPEVELPREATDDGVGATEAELTRRATADAVREAASAGRGDVPAGLRRWADVLLTPPTVSWRQRLRGAVRSGLAGAAGAPEHSYARPSRRRVPGVVLPGHQRRRPRVAVVVDTSGSMGTDQLEAALAEVEGIARSAGVAGERLRVLAVDAVVHEVADVTSARQVVLRGGGGTDLRPGVEAAVGARPRPDVVVVLTDGGTPWHDRHPAPGVRVVVALVPGPWARSGRAAPPDWCEVVEVGDT